MSNTVIMDTRLHSRDSGVWSCDRSRDNSPSCDLVITAGAFGDNLDVAATFTGDGQTQKPLYDVNNYSRQVGCVTVENIVDMSQIQIVIQNLTGKQLKPVVSSTMTVGQLKSLVADQWGLDVSQFTLTYAGKTLLDHRTLAQYDMRDMVGTANKIFLTTRLRGG